MKLRLVLSLALLGSLASLLAGPAAQAARVDPGTVVRVELLEPLSSKTARVGDKVRVKVVDAYDSAIPTGSVMVGRVTEVQRASKKQPGIIDLSFRTLEMDNGWVPITGVLSALPSDDDREAGSGRLQSERYKKPNRVKFIGYGAAGGAVLGALMGKKIINSAVIGAAAGYLYSLTRKSKSGYPDVNLKSGADFGVRLTRPANITTASLRGDSSVARAVRSSSDLALTSAAAPNAARSARDQAYDRTLDPNLGYENDRIPEDTVVQVQLLDPLSSKTARVGDRVRARVTSDDRSGLPEDSVLEGRITEVQRATKDRPGVVDVTFNTLDTGARQVPILGHLASLSDQDVTRTADGRLQARPGRKSNDLKFLGYGAAGGALLGQLLGGNLLRGALIGAAAGYILGRTQADKSKFRDVELDEGTRFGVRLANPVRLSGTPVRRTATVESVLGGSSPSPGTVVTRTRIDGRAAANRELYADRARSSVPEDTVVRVELMGRLDSRTAKVGNRVTAQVSPKDYSGIVPGTLLRGRVVEVQRATKDRPGVIDVEFNQLDTGTRVIPISGSLSPLSGSDVETTASGRVVAKKKSNNLKFIGYGAAGGAVLGALLGKKIINTAIIGAAAGYLYGLTQKGKTQYRDVVLNEGDEFGVRLNRSLNLRA